MRAVLGFDEWMSAGSNGARPILAGTPGNCKNWLGVLLPRLRQGGKRWAFALFPKTVLNRKEKRVKS